MLSWALANIPFNMPTWFNHSIIKFKNSSLVFINVQFLHSSIGENDYQLAKAY